MLQSASHSTSTLTLAEEFPHTCRQMLEELKYAGNREEEVQASLERMKYPQDDDMHFEVVIPRAASMPEQGVSRGDNLEECIRGVRRKVHCSGPLHIFINMAGSISVAVAEDDLPHHEGHVSQIKKDSNSPRVVWSRAERGDRRILTPLEHVGQEE